MSTLNEPSKDTQAYVWGSMKRQKMGQILKRETTALKEVLQEEGVDYLDG